MADDKKNFEKKDDVAGKSCDSSNDDGKTNEGSSGSESSPHMILVNFRTSGKDKEISVDENSSIDNVRNKIASDFEAKAEDIKLIFAGKIMKEHETLKENGVKDNYVVHLVIKKPAATTTSQATNSSRQGTATTTTANSPDDLFSFLGGTFPHFQDGAQAGNFNSLTDLFRNPALQNLFSDPSRVRDFLMFNPQIRALIERQPMIGHILNNPEIFRQTFEIARSPAMMQELLRNQDRAMSNLESVPGGYNALQRMYHEIQEPMMDIAANPLSSLLNDPAAGNATQSNATTAPVNPQQGTENREPLPNPWQQSQATNENRQETDAFASLLRSFVQTNPPNVSVPPSPLAPNQSTAGAGSRTGSSAVLNSFLGDVQRMFDTLNTQSGTTTTNVSSPGGSSITGTAAATSSSTMAADSTPIDYELTYRHQLSKLEEMGFYSRSENLQALIATNGNINAAIERLLTNPQ